MLAPMLRVLHSNSPTRLADRLAVSLGEAAPDLFGPGHIVVPNQATGTWLKMELARKCGDLPSMAFSTFEEALQELITPGSARILTRAHLELLLNANLPLLLERAPQIFEPVVRWIFGPSGERLRSPQGDARMAQLALELSNIFWEYITDRWDLMLSWRQGRGILRESDPFLTQTERWQRELFHQLFGDGGLRSSLRGPKWILPPEFSELPDDQRVPVRTVHFFALAQIPRSWQVILHTLAQTTECIVYYINPCEAFWEDAPTMDEPGELPSAHPLLSSLGRVGAADLRFLASLSGYNDEPCFEQPEGETRLSTLQRALLANDPAVHGHLTDTSIKIIAAPTMERECDILCNEIWQIVRGDETLNFCDIAIIICDLEHLDAYSMTIRSHLERAQIPFVRSADHGPEAHRLLAAMEQLLELPRSPLDREAMLAVLDNPYTGGEFHEHRDRWLPLIEELAVFSDREPGPTGRVVHSWEQALARLCRGALLPPEPPAEPAAPVDLPGYPPYREVGVEELAPVITRIRSLLDDARLISDSKLPLNRWFLLIRQFLSSYVRQTTSAHRRVFQSVSALLDELQRSIEDLSLTQTTVGYHIPCSLALARLAALKSHHTAYGTRGITISHLPTLRPVPFSVRFLVGLSDGVFPGRESPSVLDLRPHLGGGESHAALWSQHCLLENLTTPSMTLRLSYVAREAASGRVLEPAGVVRTLAASLLGDPVDAGGDLLARLAAEGTLEIHPDTRAHEIYYRADGSSGFAPGWSPQGYLELMATQKSQEEPLPTPAKVIPYPDDPRSISVWALTRYVKNPLQGSLILELGIQGEDLSIPRLAENDGFLAGSRSRRNLIRETLYEFHSNRDGGSLEERFLGASAMAEHTGRYPSDFFMPWALMEDLETLGTLDERLFDLLGPTDLLVTWSLGRRRKNWERIHEPLPLGSSRLTGRLWPLFPKENTFIRIPQDDQIQHTHWLEGWLVGMVGAAAELVHESFRVAMITEKGQTTRSFRAPLPQTARAWLSDLLRSADDQDNQYQLPMDRLLDGLSRGLEGESLRLRMLQHPHMEPYHNRSPLEWAGSFPLHPDPAARARALLGGQGFSFIDEYLGGDHGP